MGVGQSLRGRPTGQLVPPAAAEISSLRSHAQRGLQSPAQEMGIGAIFFKKIISFGRGNYQEEPSRIAGFPLALGMINLIASGRGSV